MRDRKSCYGCIHYRPIIGNERGCNYFFDVGKLRNVPAEECTFKNTDIEELRRLEKEEKELFLK